MKNIHVLLTDKPSRLYSYKFIDLFLHPTIVDANSSNLNCKNQNIYITSDEEIKEEDWHLVWLRDKWEILNYMPSIGYKKECLGKEVCKIILTTDEALIKDSVQAIDDEFLQWFIENPSCEEVEIKEQYFNGKDYYKPEQLNEIEKEIYRPLKKYKIIFPKEEAKQSTKDRILSETSEETKQKLRENANELVMKQTAVEWLLEQINKNTWYDESNYPQVNIGVIDLEYAKEIEKQQIERMYSEEDLKEAFKRSRQAFIFEKDMPPIYETFEDWFEQFKKK